MNHKPQKPGHAWRNETIVRAVQLTAAQKVAKREWLESWQARFAQLLRAELERR